ncbi:MAG: hypothetical protein NT139_01180 [Candidatus Woesearchaeota archaeon]|nr:hypothetical protein [Candidatus Woesearchaeota archaeon]
MSNWSELVTIRRLVRALLKDRLRVDGRDSFQFLGSASFTLSEDYPDSATIKVFKNGTLLTTGYSYNASTNILTITSLLSTNDIILITYSFYDKYSDAELTDYIESSFLYFSQFGYRKTFKLNDARTAILSIDNVNPTARECYEISIITAILIDPQNIEIRTKDFTVTAMEKESKNELISRALNQFTVWYGEFSFDEDLRQDVN